MTRILCLFAVLAMTPLHAANLVTNGDFERDADSWEPFGQGFAIDGTVAHGHGHSLRCELAETGETAGALQAVTLNQASPVPVIVSGWSRALDVSGPPSAHYSIYCDIEYTTDSRPGRVDLPGQAVRFEPGTHDWMRGSRLIVPEHPIREIKLYVLFRRVYTGTVWFDDVQLAPVVSAPLDRPAADLGPLAGDLIPGALLEAVARPAPPDRIVVIAERAAGGQPAEALDGFAVGSSASVAGELAVHETVPEFLPSFQPLPAAERYAGLWFAMRGGRRALVFAARNQGADPIRVTVALPVGMWVHSLLPDSWEPETDAIHIGRLGERVALSLTTQTEADADQLTVLLSPSTQPGGPAPVAAAGRPPAVRLNTVDGLGLDIGADGRLAVLQLERTALPAPRAEDGAVLSGGLDVHDAIAGDTWFVTGDCVKTETGCTVRATSAALHLQAEADYRLTGNRVTVNVTLRDTLRRGDRALDVVFRLPVDLTGWQFAQDITKAKTLGSEPMSNDVYPMQAVTLPDRGWGLALCIPPDSPCEFRYDYDAASRTLSLRVPLGLAAEARLPGVGSFRFELYRIDTRWGLRDALRRYYETHSEFFRDLTGVHGGWLFACATSKLPNPQDYAYHEGGPRGWEIDEELGILTCPYRIPTQREIVFPSLPESDADARARIAGLAAAATGAPAQQRANVYARLMQACAAFDDQGKPYIVRRDNVGADVTPAKPIYNVVYSVNCSPSLFADRPEVPTVGRFELDAITAMLDGNAALDGVYLDSVSGWVSRMKNFRREHFPYVEHPLSYAAVTGQAAIPGWLHTYDFLVACRRLLTPRGKVVFPNVGRGLRLPFLYFASDVIGLESGLLRGDYAERLPFYRSMAGRKPVLDMEYLEVHGKPTEFGDRTGFERFWKWCLLYGVQPSIGRSCVEAYDQFGDIYDRYRDALRAVGRAGWQPVTHGTVSAPGLIERFGAASDGLLFTVFNPDREQTHRVTVAIDWAALGMETPEQLIDLLTGAPVNAVDPACELAPEEIVVLAVPPAKGGRP
jgi:hypothetical protein